MCISVQWCGGAPHHCSMVLYATEKESTDRIFVSFAANGWAFDYFLFSTT